MARTARGNTLPASSERQVAGMLAGLAVLLATRTLCVMRLQSQD